MATHLPIPVAANPSRPISGSGRVRAVSAPVRLLLPSLSDFLFVSLMVWLFMVGVLGWSALLTDGDTGWHIRTGQYILANHHVPKEDLFSFSRPRAGWYAWEWLTDVLYALLFGWAGLKGIVLFSGVLIAATATILHRHLAARQVNAFVSLGLVWSCIGVASLHFLARPHLFTLLFLVVAMWLIDCDRRKAGPWIWLLVPLTALWTNLHGGFLVLPICLAILAVGTALETLFAPAEMLRSWSAALRYALVTVCCGLATLANPYGWRLHEHILEYLQSSWIQEAVQEFQSPTFRGEGMLYYEAILFISLVFAGVLVRRRRFVEALWIACFAHWSLHSVRHVPLFVIVVAPILAVELSARWSRLAAGRPRQDFVGILHSIGADLSPQFRRSSIWCAVWVLALAVGPAPVKWPTDFPGKIFPTAIVARHQSLLEQSRVFTEDQWADYLIFHSYPRQRVFFDGRSDFYGPELGKQYVQLSNGAYRWREILDRHRFDAVLCPVDWPLASLLKQQPDWRVLEDDGAALLFVRR